MLSRASFALVPLTLTNSFHGLPRVVWMLGAIVLLIASGRMVAAFLAVYLVDVRHLPEGAVGLVVAAYGFGVVTGSLVGGWVVSRLAVVAVLATSLTCLGLGFIGLSLVDDATAFTIGIFTCANLEGILRPVIALLFMNAVPPIDRARSHAVYYTANGLGYAVGTAMGGFLSQIDFALLFWASAGINFLAASTVALVLPASITAIQAALETQAQHEEPLSNERAWPFIVLCAATLLNYIVSHQRMATYPLYLTRHYGLDTAEVGSLFMVNGLIIAAMGIALSRSTRRLDQRWVAAFGAGFLSAGFALLPSSSRFEVAFLLCALMSFGDVLLAPASASLAYLWAPPRARSKRLGAYFAIVSIARSLGPLIGLWGFVFAGETATWLLCGLLGMLAALMLGWVLPGRNP